MAPKRRWGKHAQTRGVNIDTIVTSVPMKLFGLVSCFPSFIETDKENFFKSVNFEKRNFGETVQYCQKKLHNVAESVNTSWKVKVRNSFDNSGEKNSEDFLKTSQSHGVRNSLYSHHQSQYNYLSSNLVETNAHVLGLYKKIKEFETNSLLKMKNDIETLAHKVEEGSCLSAPESEQINTQTDIIYLYNKLDKLSETVKQLESRLHHLHERRNKAKLSFRSSMSLKIQFLQFITRWWSPLTDGSHLKLFSQISSGSSCPQSSWWQRLLWTCSFMYRPPQESSHIDRF